MNLYKKKSPDRLHRFKTRSRELCGEMFVNIAFEFLHVGAFKEKGSRKRIPGASGSWKEAVAVEDSLVSRW